MKRRELLKKIQTLSNEDLDYSYIYEVYGSHVSRGIVIINRYFSKDDAQYVADLYLKMDGYESTWVTGQLVVF